MGDICDVRERRNNRRSCRDGITKKDVAVYRGMLIADQNAKLAAFASRPAVLNYTANTVNDGKTATV